MKSFPVILIVQQRDRRKLTRRKLKKKIMKMTMTLATDCVELWCTVVMAMEAVTIPLPVTGNLNNGVLGCHDFLYIGTSVPSPVHSIVNWHV